MLSLPHNERVTDMALSNAERQRRYRERAYRDPDGHLLTRITLSLASGPAAALKRLTSGYGITQRELIERLLIQAERSVMDRLAPADLDAYLDGELPAGALQHNETGEPLRGNDNAPDSLPYDETLRGNEAETEPLPSNAETPETLPSNETRPALLSRNDIEGEPLPNNAPFTLAPAEPTEPASPRHDPQARDARIMELAGLSEKKTAEIISAEGIKCSARTVGYVRSRRNSKDAGAV